MCRGWELKRRQKLGSDEILENVEDKPKRFGIFSLYDKNPINLFHRVLH